LGYDEPPLVLKLLGVRSLICNNCTLEFRRFAPLTRLERRESREPETSPSLRRAPRHQARLRVRLYKVIKEQFGEGARYGPEVVGRTLDLSKIGLAIHVPGAQEGAGDLADPKSRFLARVELPRGAVQMLVVPVRREKLSGGGLVIGAHIRRIGEAERAALHTYIDGLN
jgi:hypothetical protein